MREICCWCGERAFCRWIAPIVGHHAPKCVKGGTLDRDPLHGCFICPKCDGRV